MVWASAVVTALFFFISILLHELAHTFVALSRGLRVRAITLFALGGIAQMEHDAADAKTEFWVGIAGPIMSVLIGSVCLLLAMLLRWTDPATSATPVSAMLVWLGYINIALAVFNMIPGFPLDGGRILRASIWWITGNASWATRAATGIGQVVAFTFIVIGLFRFFRGASIGNLWLALIGWFLLETARASYVQFQVVQNLRGLRVADVMSYDCSRVDGKLNLQTFVDEYLLRTGRRCFFVVEDGRMSGLITPHEVKVVKCARWPYTAVNDAMRPVHLLKSVRPETPVIEALELIAQAKIHQLPVLSDGRLEGILSQEQILQAFRTRRELDR